MLTYDKYPGELWPEKHYETWPSARWADRPAFQDGSDFGQAHQAVLKALERAAEFS